MSDKILVDVRPVFGKLLLYPACPKAQAFCNIAGTTTITEAMVGEIQALGFTLVESLASSMKRKALLVIA